MNVSSRTAKLFLEGDERATSEVYYAYRSLLFFIISTFVADKEDREDVYQEVFAKAFATRNECSGPQCLHSYLCSIAKNEAVNFAKKAALRRTEQLDEDMTYAEKTDGMADLLPYDLDPKSKAICGYRLAYGLSWQEIVELTGIPMSSAKAKYAQALKTVRKELKK